MKQLSKGFSRGGATTLSPWHDEVLGGAARHRTGPWDGHSRDTTPNGGRVVVRPGGLDSLPADSVRCGQFFSFGVRIVVCGPCSKRVHEQAPPRAGIPARIPSPRRRTTPSQRPSCFLVRTRDPVGQEQERSFSGQAADHFSRMPGPSPARAQRVRNQPSELPLASRSTVTRLRAHPWKPLVRSDRSLPSS